MKGFVTTAGVIILAVLIAAVSAGAEEKMKSRTPSQLKVSGTKILDAGGKEVKLRGVNAASLEWTSDGEGHILDTIRVAIRDWKVNCMCAFNERAVECIDLCSPAAFKVLKHRRAIVALPAVIPYVFSWVVLREINANCLDDCQHLIDNPVQETCRWSCARDLSRPKTC